MPLHTDILVNASRFAPGATPEATAKLNENLIKIMESGPRWYEVGAKKYREMRWNGETPFPEPHVIESGHNLTMPSREAGRGIPCRMFMPEKGEIKGLFMHIHGGGWVLQTEAYQDGLLKMMADCANLAVISIGYRLAPEHPYPRGPEDCYDAAEYLIKNGREKFGGELMFMGGESAGAHLTVVTVLHLLERLPNFSLRGLLLHFGAYDLSAFLPAVHHFDKPLIIDLPIMEHYIDAFLPNTDPISRRDPAISPFFADLNRLAREGKKMPPALFTCGTEDPLLDDTTMMSVKWQCSGAEAVVRIWPGAPHGFIMFPPAQCQAAEEGLKVTREFILGKMC